MWGWPLVCTDNALNQHNTISWFNYSYMHWGAYSIWRNNLLLRNSNLIKPCCNEVGREWALPDSRNPGGSDVALSVTAVDLQSLLCCTEFPGHFLCLGVDDHSTIWTNLLHQVYVITVMMAFNLTILRKSSAEKTLRCWRHFQQLQKVHCLTDILASLPYLASWVYVHVCVVIHVCRFACMCIYMKARGPPWLSFFRSCQSLITGSVTGLKLTK